MHNNGIAVGVIFHSAAYYAFELWLEMEEVHTSKPRRQWLYILRTLLSSGGVGDWFFPGDLKKKKKKNAENYFLTKWKA